MPPLVLRTIYGLLFEFTIDDVFSTWNPVLGSSVAFVFMALLPEYVVLLIYLYLGFYRMRIFVSSRQTLPTDAASERMPKETVL
jgi:hypothetical protein